MVEMPKGAPKLEEILVQTDKLPWREKSLKGISEKMLWRNEETGASIAMIRFAKGAGIPQPHFHTSNQFMICLSGKYEYTATGVVLTAGSFYCNPKGNVHGPAIAHEDTVVIEVYDGPHYPEKPSWYTDERDAHLMPRLEVRPGVTMAYEDHWFGAPWTTPETVVMVHGNAESSRAWDPFIPFLAGTYRVVRPDLPGFGASPEPAGYGWTVTELAADIAHFLDALAIDRCHLIGAKYGGSACMQFASEQPGRLVSLMLFGSPVRGSGPGPAETQRTKGVRQWAAETQRARLGSTASDAQIRWWTDELMGKANPKAVIAASSARIGMELDDNLSRITAPTLIVTTQESGLQSVQAVEAYARRFPDARVVVLPGDSYHIAAVEPETCARHALAFMAEVSGQTDQQRAAE